MKQAADFKAGLRARNVEEASAKRIADTNVSDRRSLARGEIGRLRAGLAHKTYGSKNNGLELHERSIPPPGFNWHLSCSIAHQKKNPGAERRGFDLPNLLDQKAR